MNVEIMPEKDEFVKDLEMFLTYELPPEPGARILDYIMHAASVNHCQVEDIIPILGRLLEKAQEDGLTLRQWCYSHWEPEIKEIFWEDLIRNLIADKP